MPPKKGITAGLSGLEMFLSGTDIDYIASTLKSLSTLQSPKKSCSGVSGGFDISFYLQIKLELTKELKVVILLTSEQYE